MGCGKQTQNHNSADNVIVPINLSNFQAESARLASPIRVLPNPNSIYSIPIAEETPEFILKTIDNDRFLTVSLSKISSKEDSIESSKNQDSRAFIELNNNQTLKICSPIAMRSEEMHYGQGFNFDFLNETSEKSETKKLIQEFTDELEFLKID